MNDPELKPCPFCGSHVSITYHSVDNTFNVWHKEGKCFFVEPFQISGDYVKSLKKAKEYWNTRI